MNTFIALSIIWGTAIILVSYFVYAYRAFNILEIIGSEGTFLEWFIVFCPIWNMVFALKNRKISDFTTFLGFINPKDYKDEYSEIKKNIETFKSKFKSNRNESY